MAPARAPYRPAKQPTAPYLEAVTAYGFRGSTRFHVPGHKGGAGADPGLRTALGEGAAARRAAGHRGHRRRALADAVRARRAARRRGLRRRALLVSDQRRDAGQPRAVPGARAPGTRVVLQRNSHASLIDGLVLSGGLASWVAPEYDAELGMAHGVTPEALEQRCAAAPDARAAFIVSPTYYGMAADVEACAEVAHGAGAALVVDNAWGAALRLSPGPARVAAAARCRRDARLHAQDRRQPHAVGDAARRATPSGSTPTRSRARSGSCARPARARC